MRKKLIAILLCIACLLPALPQGVLADTEILREGTLTYEFNNALAGSAAGTVTCEGLPRGNYRLYWANADGEKLVATPNGVSIPYSALAEISLRKAGTLEASIGAFVAIPEGAAGLLLLNSKEEVLQSLPIPVSKQLTASPTASYGVISDLHYGTFYSGGVDVATVVIPQALEFFKSIGANAVFSAGDITSTPAESYYALFAETIAEIGIPVFNTGGNHEVSTGKAKIYGVDGMWRSHMNPTIYDGSYEGLVEVAPNGIDYAIRLPGTDLAFISLSQMYWDGRSTSQAHLMDDEQLDFLEAMLADSRLDDCRIHLIFHTYLFDDDGETYDGEGDLHNPAGFSYRYAYNQSTPDEARLRGLMEAYPNVVWFNGHSHYEYAMQKYNENLNIYNALGSMATMIHVPSLTAPRAVGDASTSFRVLSGSLSQNTYMVAYDGFEIMNGYDMTNNRILADACYIVYDSESVTEEVSENGVTALYNAQLSSATIHYTGELQTLPESSILPAAQLKRVYITGTGSIGSTAFTGCTALENLEIKDGTVEIQAGAFRGLSALQKVTLPKSLQTVGEAAFIGNDEALSLTYEGTAAAYRQISFGEGNLLPFPVCNCYDVYFRVGDCIAQQTVRRDVAPTFLGTPTLPCSDPTKARSFLGWTDGNSLFTGALTAVQKDTAFTAAFDTESDRYVGGTVAGSALRWSLDLQSGCLTVSGKGAIPNYDSESLRPWQAYIEQIHTVVVKEGITVVGKQAFSHIKSLQTLILEKGVQTLGMDAFSYDSALTTVYLPSSLTTTYQGCSYSCGALRTVYYSGSKVAWNIFENSLAVYNDALKSAEKIYLTPAPTNSQYTVTFLDADGSLLDRQTVAWGEDALLPDPPAGENFVGWMGMNCSISADTVLVALYGDTTLPIFPSSEGAAVADGCISELISYYRYYGESAKTDIERLLDTMQKNGCSLYPAWQAIMDKWSELNTSMVYPENTVPEGLPTDESLAFAVLGYTLNSDGSIPAELKGRLQVALNCANAYPNAYVIVSGGGNAGGISEADAMAKWLMDAGIEDYRIIIENASAYTRYNAKYSIQAVRESYPEIEKLCIVTSDYHLCRAYLLFYAESCYDALKRNLPPLEIAGCVGYDTGKSMESLSQQANDLSYLVDSQITNDITLSILKELTVSYNPDADTPLQATAAYDSGYQKDVTDQLTVSGYDPAGDAAQTITVEYSENGVRAGGSFPLALGEKRFKSNYITSKLETALSDAKAITLSQYVKRSQDMLQAAIASAESILADENASDAAVIAETAALNRTIASMIKRTNLAYLKKITANCNQTEAYKINNNTTGDYWTSLDGKTNVPSAQAYFVLDLDGTYEVEEIKVVPYNGGNRYYLYDLYYSLDGENWTTLLEYRDTTPCTSAGNVHKLDTPITARYIKLQGYLTVVPGRSDINNIHIKEMYVYGGYEAANLCLGKPVIAGTANTGAHPSATVTDGDRDSYWDAGLSSNRPWIDIDLGGLYCLDTLNVINYWQRNDRYYHYELYTSTDGENYTKIGQKSDNAQATLFGDSFDLCGKGILASYIRLIGISNSANSSFHVNQIRAYGNRFGDITGDGIISIMDVTNILNIVAGYSVPQNSSTADLNLDGFVSIADVTTLLTMLANG